MLFQYGNHLVSSLLSIFASAALLSSAFAQSDSPLSLLVVRGGHQYDTPEFEDMCRGFQGMDVNLVLSAHLHAMNATEVDEKYDAILFLNQNKYYPELPKNKKLYMDLAKLGVGMVFLQFTLSSQPEWDEYHDLVGGKWFLEAYSEDPKLRSTYFTDLTIDIQVLDTEHPVAEGLSDFTMTDAYYGNIHMDPAVHPLLGTEHPGIAKFIAWTHQYKNAKVVYVMPGFTKGAYQHPSYIKLLENALRFVAN